MRSLSSFVRSKKVLELYELRVEKIQLSLSDPTSVVDRAKREKEIGEQTEEPLFSESFTSVFTSKKA